MDLAELILKLEQVHKTMQEQGLQQTPIVVGVPIPEPDGSITLYPTSLESVEVAPVSHSNGERASCTLACILLVKPQYNISVETATSENRVASLPPSN